MRRREWGIQGLIFAIYLIAGCAGPVKSKAQNDLNLNAPAPAFWAGRLSLVVAAADGAGSGQSLSGGFELRGNARLGELDFSAPTGQIVMQLLWSPSGATLIQGGERKQYASTQALLDQAIGASISMAQLFDWLHGNKPADTNPSAPAAGAWQVDLSGYERGRIVARRSAPQAAELRIVLERP
jgi:outer membrane lipoprotein LolB